MTVPDTVRSSLDGEEISARISIGGEDELFVTPSRTLVYRSDGLLSDESVEEYPHDADRVTISEGRRKTAFSLEYALEGNREFTVPAHCTDEVLHPVVAGVLNGNGITDPGETVVRTYRFSELTLILTSARVVKHVGEAVWDDDYEQYHFDDVTNLSFEDGSVATQVVLEVDGRQQRIKAPNEDAADLRKRLEDALCSYHDVDSLSALNDELGEDDDDPPDQPNVGFGDGVDPLETASASDATPDDATGDDPLADDPLADSTPDDASEDDRTVADARSGERASSDGSSSRSGPDDRPLAGSGFEPAATNADPELLERLDALEAAVQRQSERIEEQRRTIEQLLSELRQGR